MTHSDRAPRDLRRANRNAEAATRTLRTGAETLEAARDVMAARLEILTAGFADPTRADLAEMSLMGSEKAEALSVSMGALAQGLGRVGGRLALGAAQEADLALGAVTAATVARTPAQLLQAQMSYGLGLWGRAVSQAMVLNGDLLKAQSEALAPIHAAATANARRLKR